MPPEFIAEDVISPELATAMMRLSPSTPFCTAAFAEFMRAIEPKRWFLGTERGGKLSAGCYGIIKSGYLNRAFSFDLLPDVAYDDVFWEGLMQFCSLHRITALEISSSVGIPPLRGEVKRHHKYE